MDIAELERVLDFTPIPSPLLAPERVGRHARTYRPASQSSGTDVGFQLLSVSGDTERLPSLPAIALCLSGRFVIDAGDSPVSVERGDALFIDTGGAVGIRGTGHLVVAC